MTYQKAQELQERRTPHSQKIDDAIQAKTVYPRGLDDYSAWSKSKNRSDIEGIDTKKMPKPPEGTVKLGGKPFVPEAKGEVHPPTEATGAGGHATFYGSPTLAPYATKLVAEKFDVEKHPYATKSVAIKYERGPFGGYYRSYLVRGPGGEVISTRGNEINVNPVYNKEKEDLDATIIHEFGHFRRHNQEDAKLRKLLLDVDKEEKENTLEEFTRLGQTEAVNVKNPSYYQYHPEYVQATREGKPGDAWPRLQADDQRTLGTISDQGVRDTAALENAIAARASSTKIWTGGRVVSARREERISSAVGVVRGVPYEKRHGLRVTAGKDITGKAEDIDTYYTTSRGQYFHFYTPPKLIKGKSMGELEKEQAKYVDRVDDGKSGNEAVYAWHDGKPKVVLRGETGPPNPVTPKDVLSAKLPEK